MRGIRERLTYANVVASLALFIALGGSSYAAVQLSKDSVRSKHIKNGQIKVADLGRSAVDSTKVKDGSLLSSDFKPGQLPAGAPGPAGPTGDRGPAGSPDAPADVLAKLVQVDGTGSGLDADRLGGLNSSRYARSGQEGATAQTYGDLILLMTHVDPEREFLTVPGAGRITVNCNPNGNLDLRYRNLSGATQRALAPFVAGNSFQSVNPGEVGPSLTFSNTAHTLTLSVEWTEGALQHLVIWRLNVSETHVCNAMGEATHHTFPSTP